MSTTLRVAVIGCGAIAANHIAAYRGCDGVEVIACSDVDAARAEAFAKAHGIPQGFGDTEELFAQRPDLVSICTPHPTHAALVIRAAELGINVLCEKPLAVDPGIAETMVSACREAGVAFGAIYQRRWWPAAQRIRAALDEGALGAPMLGRVQVLLHRDPSYYSATPWRGTWAADGGGVLMTQAIHYLDLLQWYLGDVETVYAQADTYVHGEHIEVEDTLTATLRFTSGAIASFSASTGLSRGLGESIEITGTSGATVGLLEYPEGTEARTHVWTVEGQENLDPLTELAPEPDLASINGALTPFHTLQVQDMVAALREGRQPAVTGEDALRSLRTLGAIYASMRSGRAERVDTAAAMGAAAAGPTPADTTTSGMNGKDAAST
ncbi:Gfo/Idh/MocA family oxidoreductase [Galactobacter sp.]|uniref:Gfo/Idh/MocA family protein n=1 Tax=Galactobacter sp. TaxID=2676125 RepID=UPI0025BAB590|nr:Gfo/Idh/MocA family oxidoreductase [Galactobacter sp.]